MENLIRIKLDPKRGGVTDIDFKRPCFRIYNWEHSDVEIWFSDDNGVNWDKLDSDDFRFSYDFALKYLYVTLEFDIDTISQLAFFSPESKSIPVGHVLTRYDKIPVGWTLEGASILNIPSGASFGTTETYRVGGGFSILGDHAVNIPAGHTLKNATVGNTPVGHTCAAPHDRGVQVGYLLGRLETESNTVGVWILGMSEYPVEFIPLDDDTIDNLSAEAAWHKQKSVTLNGTTPEDLD